MSIPVLGVNDFLDIILGCLPRRWFAPEELQAGTGTYISLHGVASNDAMVYQNVLLVAQRRTRLTTAVGTEIEDIASDFFGDNFRRYKNETDANYRVRIVHRLLNPIATIAGITQQVQDALGTTPVIYDRMNQASASGGYGFARNDSTLTPSYRTAGYASAGSPYQGGTFAYGIGLGCWAHAHGPYSGNAGKLGYNQSGIYRLNIGAYQALITVQQPEPTDDHFLAYNQIMALISSVKPNSTVMWVRVVGPASTGGVPIM